MLYDNYSAALFGIICRIVQDEDAARDLLQDTFIKIWRNVLNYDAAKGRLFTWMLNIARNTAIDFLRVSHPGESIQNQPEIVDTIDQQRGGGQLNPDTLDVSEKVTQLNPIYQELIDLVYFKGLTHEEVSQRLNMPLGTVKTRVRAALQELKKIYNP